MAALGIWYASLARAFGLEHRASRRIQVRTMIASAQTRNPCQIAAPFAANRYDPAMQREERLFVVLLIVGSIAGTLLIVLLLSCVPGARVK
jgi:hypothetical protein